MTLDSLGGGAWSAWTICRPLVVLDLIARLITQKVFLMELAKILTTRISRRASSVKDATDSESSPTSPLSPGAPPQEDEEQPAAIDTD